jgi:crossover junction endodeoxyribonuclease RuvC
MIFIGIDPGLKGGIAVIADNKLSVSMEMPLTANKKEMGVKGIFRMFFKMRSLDAFFCIIEKAQAMPKQGVTGVFNYGRGYGELIAILKILEIPYQEIQSQKWKKEFSLIKKNKRESVNIAQKLFPSEIFMTERGRLMDGKAEACLMAEYARRQYK